MLSMSPMSGDQVGYYLNLAREDYYLQGGEPPGLWFGAGAQALGLSGQVEPDPLYNVFDGFTPDGRSSLIQRQKHQEAAEHRPGWDLTFSAPKSVSVLWSQSTAERRTVLQRLHLQAVEAALDYLQDTATMTRRGEGGKRLEQTGLVVAIFEHSTSRALDPQLHSHALVMNLSVRADGTTGTLSSLHLFQAKMAAGALYRAELARGLQEELGLELRREQSWFEVEGVAPELVRTFSKRREAIEEALRTSGLSSAQAAAAAAIQTRTVKQETSREELFREWHQEGQRCGWSTGEAERLFEQLDPRFEHTQELAAASERATHRLTVDQAHFTERDFVRYLAEEGQGRGLDAAAVRAGAAEYLAHAPEIVRLGEHRGQVRFSTQEMVALEQELLTDAQVLQANGGHELAPETVMRVISQEGAALGEEQLQAVWHLTAGSGGLAVVSGMAGTGKTRMLDVARQAWESEGYRVEGAALAARAATELEAGSDIRADTLAKTLLQLEQGKLQLGPKTVLVVDEAGMVATPDMRRLVGHCREAGAKLVLVGDERQLQPIGPGAPFRELGERHGRAELRDIRRQEQEWARQAVRDLAKGNAHAALQQFAERGLLTVSKSRAEAMQALVSQWRADGGRCEETLILAGTRQEVRTLNHLAQEERQRAGELGASSTLVGGERVYLHDRVMFTQNRRTLGVQNGARGTVSALAEDGSRLSVELDSGERVTLQPQAFPRLTLGYASTTHKAQGATTQRAYVLGGGPMQARELAYVQASRARLETRLFATAAETGDDLAQLAREMERSRQKEMAHTVLREQVATSVPSPDPDRSQETQATHPQEQALPRRQEQAAARRAQEQTRLQEQVAAVQREQENTFRDTQSHERRRHR